ncbi:hypothetical protein [Nocardia sp. NBC_01327]|uniref:hypothetical protein n=1 Tax=Nocardia sp. NBC_01327 TaxID=2903593 RepID=UPI002E0E8614|nr:hypothetical protein OG326_23305 [Nocardia sp. NBC_01327]
MTSAPPSSALPAYSEFVSTIERAPERVAARWPFVAVIVLGVLLVAAPLITGMLPRAIKGEAMIDAFHPYIASKSIQDYRDDLHVLDEARTNVLAIQANGGQPGKFDYVDKFVQDYPSINANLTGMVDSIDANQDNYRKLSSTAPFGALPWLLALPGLVLITAGGFGLRAARNGKRGVFWHGTAALAGLALLAVPLTGGLFQAAPAAQPLINDFRPILTHDEVRTVQGYFVTIVAADGELNSRYVSALKTARPDADRTGITALEARWQPMTARFAALVGVLNDNVGNFDAVVALNDSTKPLGLTAFRGLGWGFVIPGSLALAVAAAGLRPALIGSRRGGSKGGTSK